MKSAVNFLCVILLSHFAENEGKKPNIVIIVADDMGWNDVSFHGSNQFLTPNMDALAYNGIMLNRHYVPPLCTPSRASLMTGKYPTRTGMQHWVVVSDEPWGLGLEEKIMPQFFHDAGYNTHLVGKWHLGFFEKEYTPTFRGFDEHIGYLGPYIDYWNHSLIMLDRNYSRGHDMRKNMTVDLESSGVYATNHFSAASEHVIQKHNTEKPLFLIVNHLAPHTANENDPMQAPEDEIKKFSYIKNKTRRILAAMVSLLDKSVGKVVESLKKKDMLNNTIILFYSDNGAPTVGMHSNRGSNYPFKGQKNTPFEGGVRVPAFIWSPLFKHNQRVSNQMIHNSDWLPTLAEAAKIRIKGIDLDGVSQWNSLVNSSPGPRKEILHNIDDYSGYSSYMNDGWKLVNATLMPGLYDNASINAISKGLGWIGQLDNDFNMTDEEYVKAVLKSPAGKILAKSYPYKLPTKDGHSFPFWNAEPSHEKPVILALREEATIRCFWSKLKIDCNPVLAPCLFNVIKDPCEYINLADVLPFKVQKMKWNLERHRQRMVKTRRQPSDPACDPINFDLEWTWWRDGAENRSGRSANYASLYALDLIEDIADDPIEENVRFLNKTITLKSLIIAGGVAVLVCITFKMAFSFRSTKVKPFEVAK